MIDLNKRESFMTRKVYFKKMYLFKQFSEHKMCGKYAKYQGAGI